ncbi:uncharacterized protein TRIADDRAFT_63840 [Trichoplax adhaerens]|uniref:DOMON domain-containing protein n=1 Tax=Trichoplax adhaerens TaxID=10228 RepID=B3RUZ2_TRIAD|nr:hypothetical protein TRIADDRAFT_63840 [Trichoplax adhaerens]EDV25404.1 hypothetical protein TRIADDRAFT_63840 [Trichoplax adhaerens]|eukprot:XP_002111437.1 hypothetical protein TRIADDRAFT_63840 [Trichoplax adhaerens]
MRYIVVILYLTFTAALASTAGLKESYRHFAYLDENEKFQMYWTANDTLQMIDIAIAVQTTGWVGFGFSPYTGRMPGSDVVIGWVDNQGKIYLQDRFATGHTVPELDTQQDYTLFGGEETNGMTILKFKRKYVTGDSKDLAIEDGTTKLIWSYHTADPTAPNVFTKHEFQGTRSINLFNRIPEFDKPPLPSDVQYVDVLAKNITIPAQHTVYWCTAIKLPELNNTGHIIKIAPKLVKGNEALVHHILIYDCIFEDHFHGASHDCDSRNMPYGLRRCRGATVIGAWAVGGEPFSLPAHVGLPIGGSYGSRYVVMETHYDNPNLYSGIKDSSGMRFYYTSQKRQYDAGMLQIGQSVNPFHMIPEGQKTWQSAGYCPSYCTQRNLPATGINIIGSILHTHLVGRSLQVKHHRQKKELPFLAHNPHYDFNYQDIMFLKKERKVLPGDQMTLICGYDTSNRSKITVGGISTRNEMCLAYFLYYPIQELSACMSYIPYASFLPFLNSLRATGRIPPYNDYPSKAPYVWNVLENATFGQGKYLSTYRKLENELPINHWCAARGRRLLQEVCSKMLVELVSASYK